MTSPHPSDHAGPGNPGVAGPLDIAAVEAAVAVAIRAPSIYNTQPWRWQLGPGALELRADRSRQLAVIDPDGHSRLISCGVVHREGSYRNQRRSRVCVMRESNHGQHS